MDRAPYDLSGGLVSRSVSFENPTGAKGAGGQAASPLGVGRKGDPARLVAPGECVTLCDIEGPGTIRHIWMTTLQRPAVMRGFTVRAWWDGQAHPSVEAPLGDFFGFAHGRTKAFESAVHSVGEANGLNIWLPMPFRERARITLTNDIGHGAPLFYQVDYTLGDVHPPGVGRLHAAFRRENPTTAGADFELMARRAGRGRYIGAVIGVRPLAGGWWGEGEVKMYLDGDNRFATIVGTGAEDYVGLSFCIQETPFRFHGANWREKPDRIDTGRVGMYRWHLPDPVFFERDIRVTMQQIGIEGSMPRSIDDYKAMLRERQDDWSCAAFWYEAVPSAPLPPPCPLDVRLADLPAPDQ